MRGPSSCCALAVSTPRYTPASCPSSPAPVQECQVVRRAEWNQHDMLHYLQTADPTEERANASQEFTKLSEWGGLIIS